MQAEPDTQIVPPRDGDRPAAPAKPEEPVILQRWVGRYELIQRLAHGGMATVYLGRAKGKAGFEKVVAVKVIHPHLANEPEFVGMFLDEARIAARIHHPHVVEMLDLGEDEGVYYMVMEFIEGENLAALVRALGRRPKPDEAPPPERLPISVILQLLADTLEGLSAAHETCDADGQPYKLVHRDVSPHNILINLDGWAKVGDFGIMKAAGKASNTRTGELRGKLAYMSPEQARGGAVDLRTDLFAVGVIAWELLMGRRLFACSSDAATLEKVMACEVPKLDRRELAEDNEDDGKDDATRELREGLQALLDQAMAPDPEQRFATAAQMLAEVKRLLRICEGIDESCPEPRAYLGELMQRFFRGRVDYARAALRRTGEHPTLSQSLGSSRELESSAVDPTVQVRRPPTASNPSLSGPGEVALDGSAAGLDARLQTGSNPALASGAHAPLGPRAQWLLWLLLPMLGAALAVIAMLLLDPFDREAARERDEDGPHRSPAPDPNPAQTPSQTSSLAATEYQPTPRKPAREGLVHWSFSTEPRGATVIIDGEAWDEPTPTTVEVPAGDAPLEVVLELEGYVSKTQMLAPLNDQSYYEDLEPSAPTPAGSKLGVKRKRAPKPEDAGSKSSKTSKPETDGGDEQAEGKKKFLPMPASLEDTG